MTSLTCITKIAAKCILVVVVKWRHHANVVQVIIKILLRNPRILVTLLWLYGSFLFFVFCFFGESPLTPTSTLERKYWFEFLKCWPHEGSVEMHQLRAGRHKCQPCFTYSRGLFVLCNYSFCLPTLPSPSSAVLLNQSILASDDLVPAIRSCVQSNPATWESFATSNFAVFRSRYPKPAEVPSDVR